MLPWKTIEIGFGGEIEQNPVGHTEVSTQNQVNWRLGQNEKNSLLQTQKINQKSVVLKTQATPNQVNENR